MTTKWEYIWTHEEVDNEEWAVINETSITDDGILDCSLDLCRWKGQRGYFTIAIAL